MSNATIKNAISYESPLFIINSNAGGIIYNMVTSLSTSSVTIMGSSTTGFLFLEGF